MSFDTAQSLRKWRNINRPTAILYWLRLCKVSGDAKTMIKVIFFDVDGTLLSHKLNAVPESTRAAIAQIREKGIKTVIATGRHMIELSKLPMP